MAQHPLSRQSKGTSLAAYRMNFESAPWRACVTEFLAETTLDTYQHRFIDTVKSCGWMLLETINHVLDFRKLTSLVRDQNTQMVGIMRNDAAALLASHQQSKVKPFMDRVVFLIKAPT